MGAKVVKYIYLCQWPVFRRMLYCYYFLNVSEPTVCLPGKLASGGSFGNRLPV